jgi:hypothetical protein
LISENACAPPVRDPEQVAGDLPGFAARIAAWPMDVRDHALRLADSNA